MSTESPNTHEKFLRGTQKCVVESSEQVEKEPASESSSSSDGSNEPQPNQPNSDQVLNQSATSILQRPQVSFEPSTENPAPFSTQQSQQTGNLLPNCTLATSSQLYPPGRLVETSLEAGVFQPLNSQQDMNISNRNQLSFPLQLVTHGSPFPMDQSLRMSRNSYGSSSNNSYHLPTSNLPSDFRLESSSSSRSPVPQIHHQHSQIPRTSGNVNNGSSLLRTLWSNRNAQHQINMHEPSSSTFGPQEFSFQGLLGSAIGSPSFRPSGGTNPFQIPNMPLQKRMELSLPLQSDGIPTNSNSKMKISWQDNTPPSNFHPLNWSPQEQGSLGQTYSLLNASNSRYFKNSVYDPMYEAMGLPVDPHLRMFMASRENGDEEQ